MGIFGSMRRPVTQLIPAEEREFQIWRASLPPNLQNMSDYDLRGAYKSNAKAAANGHLPDTYKLPNHMTFSSDSQYSTPQAPGGQWVGSDKTGWAFYASPTNLQYHNSADLWNYFKQVEPDSGLVLPIDWSLPASMRAKR